MCDTFSYRNRKKNLHTEDDEEKEEISDQQVKDHVPFISVMGCMVFFL